MKQYKINHIAKLIEKTTYSDNYAVVEDALNQIVILYEITISILLDVENSIIFAQIEVLISKV